MKIPHDGMVQPTSGSWAICNGGPVHVSQLIGLGIGTGGAGSGSGVLPLRSAGLHLGHDNCRMVHLRVWVVTSQAVWDSSMCSLTECKKNETTRIIDHHC